MITHSIEISRTPQDVFAYLDDVERHGEWQDAIVSTKVQTPGPLGVGSRVLEIRKAGGREQDASYVITEHDPPRKTAFRGVAGPLRPVGTVTVEPVDGGLKARVSIDFDLVGYGFGKVIAPLARMQARKAIATSQEQLKAKLEAGV